MSDIFNVHCALRPCSNYRLGGQDLCAFCEETFRRGFNEGNHADRGQVAKANTSTRTQDDAGQSRKHTIRLRR